jgi:hypothetical protein
MRWLELAPRDPPVDTEVFFTCANEGHARRLLRRRYADLACAKCKKFDEYAALARGLDEDVALTVSADIQSTLDFCVVVSARMRDAMDCIGTHGLGFIPNPQRGAFVVRPLAIAPTDPAVSKIDFRGRKPCPVCGRYSITAFAPSVAAMRLPTDPLVICSPSLRPEHRSVAQTMLLMSDVVAERLRALDLNGINWDVAENTY